MSKLLESLENIENNTVLANDNKKREKFNEIINFVKNHNNTISSLEPKDFAYENGAAYVVANNLRNKMKVNQLRKFFTQIKKIDNELKGRNEDEPFDINKIALLLPELAYAYGRGLITEEFYNLMKLCLQEDKIPKIKDFRQLVKFLTAVLAYYKMLSK